MVHRLGRQTARLLRPGLPHPVGSAAAGNEVARPAVTCLGHNSPGNNMPSLASCPSSASPARHQPRDSADIPIPNVVAHMTMMLAFVAVRGRRDTHRA